MKLPHFALMILGGLTLLACAQTPHTATHHAPSFHHTAAHPPMTHTIDSAYDFNQTLTRLSQAIQSKGMTIFATIDHTAAAKQAGLTMQPATVLVFGNPKVGTPLMVKDPSMALRLPLRVLVTELDGKVKVSFQDTHAVIHGTKIEYSEVANTLANAEKLIRATVSQ